MIKHDDLNDSLKGRLDPIPLMRVISKFIESDGEKVARLVEISERYWKAVKDVFKAV